MKLKSVFFYRREFNIFTNFHFLLFVFRWKIKQHFLTHIGVTFSILHKLKRFSLCSVHVFLYICLGKINAEYSTLNKKKFVPRILKLIQKFKTLIFAGEVNLPLLIFLMNESALKIKCRLHSPK